MLTTPQGIAAALRAIQMPNNPTSDLISTIDAKVQESLAAVDSMRDQAAAHLDSGSPNLDAIAGAVEASKRSIQEAGEAAKLALDDLWTSTADVGVAIDRAADEIGRV
jgi:hypothetical protein